MNTVYWILFNNTTKSKFLDAIYRVFILNGCSEIGSSLNLLLAFGTPFVQQGQSKLHIYLDQGNIWQLHWVGESVSSALFPLSACILRYSAPTYWLIKPSASLRVINITVMYTLDKINSIKNTGIYRPMSIFFIRFTEAIWI